MSWGEDVGEWLTTPTGKIVDVKFSKKCPECSGTEIYATTSKGYGEGLDLLPGATGWLGVWDDRIDIFVCGNCGCYQMFVRQEALAKVKENFQRYS